MLQLSDAFGSERQCARQPVAIFLCPAQQPEYALHWPVAGTISGVTECAASGESTGADETHCHTE